MKPKVLFYMHMPPPVHGAAQMGQIIHDSALVSGSFDCKYLNPSASTSVNQVGHLSLGKIRFFFSSIRRLEQMIDNWQPDLVYLTPSSWDWGFYRDYMTMRMLKKKKVRIVAHYHNKGVKRFMDKWYNRLLYANYFKGIYTIFLTKGLTKDFERYLSGDQMFICPNGIDRPSSVCEIKREKQMQAPFHFLFLSNMMAEKGVWVLLDACKRLKESGEHFTCTFIGKWSDITEQRFFEEVRLNSLTGYVDAVGAKYGPEKIGYFQKADCFVFPTYYHGECFPLVLLEAMSYGLPCISTNEGGIPDLIDDGVNGVVVEKMNASELVAAMANMINNPIAAAQMGQNALKKYEQEYTQRIFEKRMCDILNRCLQ